MRTIPVPQGDPFWRSCEVEVPWQVLQEEERSPLRGNFTLLSDDLYPLDHVLGALSAIGYVLSGTMSWFYSHWSLFFYIVSRHLASSLRFMTVESFFCYWTLKKSHDLTTSYICVV